MDFKKKKDDTIEIPVESEDAILESDEPISEESEIDEIQDFIKKLQQENEELDDKLLRLAADFENFRKRQERILAQMIEQERNNVIGRLLEVANDVERALDEVEKNSDPNAVYEGIKLVSRRIKELLRLEGVEADDPTDKPFDPLEHEAVAVIDVDSPELDGIVIEIIEPCYKRDGKLVCPAKVIVGKYDEAKD